MIESIFNSEILLLYEAKNCNPNGDPDAENRPRIDAKTGINFVSDVRLKRFFRDYLVSRFGEKFVYVTKLSGKSVRADERLSKITTKNSDPEDEISDAVLKNFIDARLFGATIPIGKGDETRGKAMAFIGPVQFTWGFSLHRTELIDFPSITSVFSGREESKGYGTVGKDWRLYYSLLAFYGVVSGRRAIGTRMSETDLKIMDNFLWTALETQPTTRSKLGERPHLYLRIEYKDQETVLGDLRRFLKTSPRSTIRDFNDVCVDFSGLAAFLEKNKDRIYKVYVRTSEETEVLKQLIKSKKNGFEIIELPHKLTVNEISLLQECESEVAKT